MLLWFCGTAIVSVWFVFRDPAFDYRLLCVGALLPDAIDVWFGGARAFHSVTTSIAVLLAVVIASAGRKRWRKRALAIPIGMLLHLVFDGAFTKAKLFWWPIGGLHFRDVPLPTVSRGLLDIPLELIGLALLAWVWRAFGLRSPARRRSFLRTGRLEMVVAPAAPVRRRR
ncbi:MAG: hypothetical protein JWM34_1390 [Ilumatobacteraceae bacterium]|nr:hypothetical protein [Ilumatobacteraceae bacterium]